MPPTHEDRSTTFLRPVVTSLDEIPESMEKIMMTFDCDIDDLADGMKRSIVAWQKFAPQMTVVYLNEAQRIRVVSDCLGSDGVEAYKKMKGGAHRADFARAAYLWKYGGHYSDIDQYPTETFRSAIGPDEFRCMNEPWLFHSTICNSYLAFGSAGHPLAEKVAKMTMRAATEEGFASRLAADTLQTLMPSWIPKLSFLNRTLESFCYGGPVTWGAAFQDLYGAVPSSSNSHYVTSDGTRVQWWEREILWPWYCKNSVGSGRLAFKYAEYEFDLLSMTDKTQNYKALLFSGADFLEA